MRDYVDYGYYVSLGLSQGLSLMLARAARAVTPDARQGSESGGPAGGGGQQERGSFPLTQSRARLRGRTRRRRRGT